MDGDQRQAHAVAGRLAERAPRLGFGDGVEVLAVLVLLLVRHVDFFDVDLGRREREADFLCGPELAVLEDDAPEHIEVDEAGADALRHVGHRRGVDDVPHLDLAEDVNELLRIRDADLGPGVVIDELNRVVELQGAVLGRRRAEQDDARAAGVGADRGAAEVHLPSDGGALPLAAHVLGHAALARLGQVEVLAALRLVEHQQVNADIFPDDPRVVLPVFRELEALRDPASDPLLEHRFLALGELLSPADGALAQGHLPRDAGRRTGIFDDACLAHLRAGQRLVGHQDDVVLAGLEARPGGGAVGRRVRLAGLVALLVLLRVARDRLALTADDANAVVRERLADVPVPLPDDRSRHHDHRPLDPALLTRTGDDRQARVGLANANIERHQATSVREHAAGAGVLVRRERDALVPARQVERRGAVLGRAKPLEKALIGLLDPLAAILGRACPRDEALAPRLRDAHARFIEGLGSGLGGPEQVLVVIDPPDHVHDFGASSVVALPELVVGLVDELDDTVPADEADLSLSVRVLVADPLREQIQREPCRRRRPHEQGRRRVRRWRGRRRRSQADIVEHRRSDQLDQPSGLSRGLFIAERSTGLGAIVLRPELAKVVDVGRFERAVRAKGRIIVFAPARGEERRELRPAEVLASETPVLTIEILGLGHQVVGHAGVARRELGFGREAGNELGRASHERIEEALRPQIAVRGELQHVGVVRRRPVVSRPVAQPAVKLLPSERRHFALLRGDGSEEPVHPASERRSGGEPSVGEDGCLALWRHLIRGRWRHRLERQVRARLADGPLDEIGQRGERADDGLRLPPAVVLADLAEHVLREVFVIAALEDAGVGRIRLFERARTRAEEDEIECGVVTAREELAGQPVRAREVVPEQHLLAQLRIPLGRARQEPGRDQVDSEPTGGQEIEPSSQEILVRRAPAASSVGAFAVRGDLHPDVAIGWIGDNEVEPAPVVDFVLRNPTLERPLVEVQLGPERAEDRGGEGAVLDAVPSDVLEAGAAESSDEAPDAAGRLQRVDVPVRRSEAVHTIEQRHDDTRHLRTYVRRRVIFVDQRVGVRLGETRRKATLVGDIFDRETTPTAVERQRAPLIVGERARVSRHLGREVHGGEVGVATTGHRPEVLDLDGRARRCRGARCRRRCSFGRSGGRSCGRRPATKGALEVVGDRGGGLGGEARSASG